MAPLLHLETDLRIPIVLSPNNPLTHKSLAILEASSKALSNDIDFFRSSGLYQNENNSTRAFVISAAYYGSVLIFKTWEQFEGDSAISSDPHHRRQLDFTAEAVNEMVSRLNSLRREIEHWTLPWPRLQRGDQIPTAGPYQLLYQALLEQINMSDMLKTMD